jgi:hypothetical protein
VFEPVVAKDGNLNPLQTHPAGALPHLLDREGLIPGVPLAPEQRSQSSRSVTSSTAPKAAPSRSSDEFGLRDKMPRPGPGIAGPSIVTEPVVAKDRNLNPLRTQLAGALPDLLDRQ